MACSAPGPGCRAQCWIANWVFANISILLIYMGPSLSKYCMALTTREKLAHAPRLSSDWSMSWFTLLLLVDTGPCKHFLPFVNRKCHTLAPPPTVTTHHPQTLGNDDNWGLADKMMPGKYRVCHHGEWLIGCHNIGYIIALIIILRGPD